jgi:hypothetical protein
MVDQIHKREIEENQTLSIQKKKTIKPQRQEERNKGYIKQAEKKLINARKNLYL